MHLPSHNRYDYDPIKGRRVYDWPDATRLAVYIAINVEHFAFGEGLGAELAPGGPQPDILNFAWRDYGNRVGIWRLLDLCDELQLPACGLINSSIYDACPSIPAAFCARGDEIVAHGRSNAERQSVLDEAEERALIDATTATIAMHEGVAPRGWLGPWIAESRSTPDLLKERGYEYLLDWCMDDQPVWLRTRSGPILSIPYPQEINDIPAIAVRRASATEFADMIRDNFAEMYDQAASGPLVMGIALHPYIVGQPYRLRALRPALKEIAKFREKIWLTRPGDINAHVRQLEPEIAP
ncbi:polysaccharide deacetylase family protein [Candidatus Methylospira mobilis]|uniref:Polysaccharide deacetylase family protein n=2 Tax=Candidatus Methylospira mobilis TaxID=1808979 RepID=A0A5Q0BP20_9GAMM|nr:polysaccharide deacetylase family protein [Candidatus Methylospira mobilis]